MSTAVRQSLQIDSINARAIRTNGEIRNIPGTMEELSRSLVPATVRRTRIFVAAENRLLQDALSRMLAKRGDMEVVGPNSNAAFQPEFLCSEETDILLLTSRGSLAQDIGVIRKVRATTPAVQILLLGVNGDEIEFLQYVRAGIRGYLLRDASAEDVVASVRAMQVGEAVCPGMLSATLFRYLEREATTLPSATAHQRLGLTRREQQLIPFIAQGLTNKEIANHFCLSEQTVKNHLYRMKHKVKAEDRLGIVQMCRSQGFML